MRYKIDDNYVRVGKVWTAKNNEKNGKNNYQIQFVRQTWGLLQNEYWKEIGQVGKNRKTGKDQGLVPKFAIYNDFKKVGIAIVHKNIKEEPYLLLIKYRDGMQRGIAGKQRMYYIHDLDKNLDPVSGSLVTYRIYNGREF